MNRTKVKYCAPVFKFNLDLFLPRSDLTIVQFFSEKSDGYHKDKYKTTGTDIPMFDVNELFAL